MKDRAAWKAPVALCEIDINGLIIAVNELFLEWSGLSRMEALGDSVPHALELNEGLFEQVVADAESGPAQILARHTPAIGPGQVIVAATALGDGHCIIALMNAVGRHEIENQLRVTERALTLKSQRLAMLLDAALAFADATSEEELSELLADSVRTAFEASSSSVHLMRDGMFILTGGKNALENVWPLQAPPPGARTMSEGRVLIIENRDAAETYLPNMGMADILREAGVNAVVVSPILDHGHAFGTVVCFFNEERAIDEQTEPLITALAQQAAAVFTRLTWERAQRRAAMIDEVTQLPNRRLFEIQLERSGKRSRGRSAVLFIDLDGFKRVNDELGHGVGDRLLAEVGHRLLNIQRSEDNIARYGGDEFVAYFEAPDDDAALTVAERVREALARPYDQLPPHIRVSASIGVASRDDTTENTTVEHLIRRADQAMYRAKQAGGNAVVLG